MSICLVEVEVIFRRAYGPNGGVMVMRSVGMAFFSFFLLLSLCVRHEDGTITCMQRLAAIPVEEGIGMLCGSFEAEIPPDSFRWPAFSSDDTL